MLQKAVKADADIPFTPNRAKAMPKPMARIGLGSRKTSVAKMIGTLRRSKIADPL
ncbi:hypothetical protein OMP40_27205 [Cohnella rhizosphaerae]|uniref:Uncharacterized protein n=1 Tax=Cohnella rhizosphaerae TaxID=1457232 RepID=A0A9X4KWS2_9BACL|nr:hypothetical protein [Cohnella rhizosphaerae]MDG0812610.1 hypothetical protein [Cohnella rhizosphaerae]